MRGVSVIQGGGAFGIKSWKDEIWAEVQEFEEPGMPYTKLRGMPMFALYPPFQNLCSLRSMSSAYVTYCFENLRPVHALVSHQVQEGQSSLPLNPIDVVGTKTTRKELPLFWKTPRSLM